MPTVLQYSEKKSTPAKQQIAITHSELQLLLHEGFLMKTHHKADTKDPALTNRNQPTLIPTSMFQVHLCSTLKDYVTILGNGPFYFTY